MITISNLVLEVQDGSTIASTEIYGADKKTYINIGSGDVFYLKWNLDQLSDDTLDHFNVVIKRYDPTLGVYYNILDKDVGLVLKVLVNSNILPVFPLQYMLSIYVVAYGKQGSVITSNVVNPYVCKSSGAYVKVESKDNGPIMKRALAFAKITQAGIPPVGSLTILADADGLVFQDSDAKKLVTADGAANLVEFEAELTAKDSNNETKVLVDEDGNELFATATRLLNSINGWEIIQESYVKGPDDTWHITDISDSSGEIITDENGESIYVL